jgi:SPRY domain-containing SOCS box protein 3
MMFGIGTKEARLHVDAFVNMLGENKDSWGMSHKGFLWHGSNHKQYTKSFKENVSTTIGLYFDGFAGTLTYYKDGVSLGVAFTGLADIKDPLYPIICSTAAKTEMSLGVTKREFTSIQDRCRSVILRHLSHEDQINQLELPKTLKRFISEGLSEDSQEDMVLTLNNMNS